MNRRRQILLGVGLAAWATPWAGRAQPDTPAARIGWISVADPGVRVEEFRDGLRALGYVGAREVRIETRIVQRSCSCRSH
jgi:hypothetical protein